MTTIRCRLLPLLAAVFLCAAVHAQTTDVSIQKLANDAGGPGIFSYLLFVSNSGPAVAANVTVTDVLPAPVLFVGMATAPGWICTTPSPGTNGTVQCIHPAMPSSQGHDVRIDVMAAPGTPPGTLVTNTGTVTTSTPETTTANNSSTRTTALLVRADTTVQITDSPDPVGTGGVVTYTVTAVNNGPDTAPNAVLTIDPHSGASFNSISAPAGWTCTPPSSPDAVITCTTPSFAVGTAPFTLQVTAPDAPGGFLGVLAGITSSAIEITIGNQVRSETTAIAPSPFLFGVKNVTSGGQVVGSNVTYTIVVTNAGTAAQNDNPGDELVDVLPSTLALISTSATSGTAVANVAGNRVTWNGALAARQSVTITITALVLPAAANTPVSNSAQIRYDRDGDGANEASASTNVATFTPAAAPAGNANVPTASGMALLLLAAMLSAMALLKLR